MDSSSVCVLYEPLATINENKTGYIITDIIENNNIKDKYINCSSQYYCYTFWTYGKERNFTIPRILKQGCWSGPNPNDCDNRECVAVTPSSYPVRNFTRFCCCTGNLCNANFMDAINLTAYEILEKERNSMKRLEYNRAGNNNDLLNSPLFASLICIVIILFILSVILLIAKHKAKYLQYFCKKNIERTPFLNDSCTVSRIDSNSGVCINSSISSEVDLVGLQVNGILCKGRYGVVYKALLNGIEVAVKVYHPIHRQYYLNEKTIFGLLSTLSHHPSIVEYIGHFEIFSENKLLSTEFSKFGICNSLSFPRMMIITTLEQGGTLENFLKNNSIDWNEMCKICHSIVLGLCYLHETKYKEKPIIAHRDLNPRNILMKSDMTCCLCDFGFALMLENPRTDKTCGYETVPDNSHNSIADVGTLRYMSPEILEGSVNLHDCTMSLRQVDIYALALVIWEVASRCHVLYQDLETPAYKLAFEEEIGLHPSYEDMHVLVSRNKCRPAFPSDWLNNMAVSSLKEIIERCWDQDAEARVSVVCVEEELREWPSLWHTVPTNNKKVSVNSELPLSNLNQSHPPPVGYPYRYLQNSTSATNSSLSNYDSGRSVTPPKRPGSTTTNTNASNSLDTNNSSSVGYCSKENYSTNDKYINWKNNPMESNINPSNVNKNANATCYSHSSGSSSSSGAGNSSQIQNDVSYPLLPNGNVFPSALPDYKELNTLSRLVTNVSINQVSKANANIINLNLKDNQFTNMNTINPYNANIKSLDLNYQNPNSITSFNQTEISDSDFNNKVKFPASFLPKGLKIRKSGNEHIVEKNNLPKSSVDNNYDNAGRFNRLLFSQQRKVNSLDSGVKKEIQKSVSNEYSTLAKDEVKNFKQLNYPFLKDFKNTNEIHNISTQNNGGIKNVDNSNNIDISNIIDNSNKLISENKKNLDLKTKIFSKKTQSESAKSHKVMV